MYPKDEKFYYIKGFLKNSAYQIWHEKYHGWNQPFTKFIEAANNFAKSVEFANSFMKFAGLANNFDKLRRSCEQLYKVCGTRQ